MLNNITYNTLDFQTLPLRHQKHPASINLNPLTKLSLPTNFEENDP